MRTADIPNSNYYIREDGKVFRKSDNKEVAKAANKRWREKQKAKAQLP